MENIIEIKNLTKSFGEVKAVKDISFRVKDGEFFAFLGVNGAGKSTTINIICAQLSKDSGSVIIDGKDLDKDSGSIKREIGVVFQSSVLDMALSVYDNLESRAALYGITGESFKTYLNKIRIKRAKTLLSETNAPVGNIALNVGFDDVNYFSRVFKKQTGMTPGEYKDSINNE